MTAVSESSQGCRALVALSFSPTAAELSSQAESLTTEEALSCLLVEGAVEAPMKLNTKKARARSSSWCWPAGLAPAEVHVGNTTISLSTQPTHLSYLSYLSPLSLSLLTLFFVSSLLSTRVDFLSNKRVHLAHVEHPLHVLVVKNDQRCPNEGIKCRRALVAVVTWFVHDMWLEIVFFI